MPNGDVFLEVIAATVEDAIAAETGGAARLEIVRALDQGGLTPFPEVVQAIRSEVSIPIRVMVRESPTFTISGEDERSRLLQAAATFAGMGVEGLVLGFLEDRTAQYGGIDIDSTMEILAQASGLRATFHRAFEAVRDPARALSVLKAAPQIDRILVSGGSGSAGERRARLEALAQLAEPEIAIVAGGSVAPETLRSLCTSPWLREFHVGRAAREPEEPLAPVSAARIRNLVTQIRHARMGR